MRRVKTSVDAISVTISVVIIAITLFVGFEVMGNVSQAELEAASKEIETVCNGVFGCDGIQWYEWVPMLATPILALGVGYIMRIVDSFDPDDSTDSTDPVVVVQEKYVNGEIETEEQLERELEWYLYPDHTDSDE